MSVRAPNAVQPLDLRRKLSPQLLNLRPEVHNAALQVCWRYRLVHELRSKHQNVEHVVRSIEENTQEITQVWKQLKKLQSQLNKVEHIINSVEPHLPAIRSRHIPVREEPVSLLPGRDPVAAYFRQRGLPDPAIELTSFFTASRQLSGWLGQEIKFLQGESKRLWETDPALFYHKGLTEYILVRLFAEHSRRRLKVHEVYDNVRAILTCLDGGAREPAAVRMAVTRVKKNPSLRDDCEHFLASWIPKTPARK